MAPEPSGVWRERLRSAGDLGPLHPSLLEHLALPMLQGLEQRLASVSGRRPLLALNGPVGAGKSSLGRALERLAALGGLRLAVVSIDDVYLPAIERRQVLAGNPFGVSRVPPGSHDLPLLLAALGDWRAGGRLRLPRFDKTLAGGQGDRAGWRQQQADAVVIEGWLMGCRALGPRALSAAMGRGDGIEALTAAERPWLPRWDEHLDAYAPLWRACDGLWLLHPQSWDLPRRWRFQAEARQRRSGGGWLDAGQLEALVRATLHSLPPALYQEPLRQKKRTPGSEASPQGWELPLEGGVLLDGRRRCRPLPLQLSSAASASSSIG